MTVSPEPTTSSVNTTVSAETTASDLRRVRRELHEIATVSQERFREYVSWALLTVDAAVAHVDGLAGVGPDFRLHTDAAGAHVTSTPSRRPRNGKVTTKHVDPVIWENALELANGDPKRLRVISVTSVIVVNRPS